MYTLRTRDVYQHAALFWYLVYVWLSSDREALARYYQVFAPQRSLEWHVARYGRIGASTSGVPCGISPYNGPLHLYEVLFKPGLDPRCWDFPSNEATAHGTKYEPLACMLYELTTGNCVAQTGLWINTRYPAWEHSSPDGIVYEPGCAISSWRQLVFLGDNLWIVGDGLLEIKCPIFKLYCHVPAYYAAQTQQQMRTRNFGWTDFFVYFHEGLECALWRIYRCEAWNAWTDRRYKIFAACRSIAEASYRLPPLAHSMQTLIDTNWDWVAAARAQKVSVAFLKEHLPLTPLRIEKRWHINLQTQSCYSYTKPKPPPKRRHSDSDDEEGEFLERLPKRQRW